MSFEGIGCCSFYHDCPCQENTGLDGEQIEALKKGFDGFDKEQAGIISGTAMQMIFKMLGFNVQVRQALASIT